MKRKIYKNLLEWKNSGTRKPLLLLGARQVGKTWVMKEFGRREYENVVYINCDNEPLTKTLFVDDYNIDRLILGFQAIAGVSINAENTLIILDEIQEAPRGLHSLKYFYEDAPQYHIIAAGSLLGVTLSRTESFPVGKVDMLRMYPLDFTEFINAVGQSSIGNLLKEKQFSLVETFGKKYEELLFQYYFVGGMPEAVQSFIDRNDPNEIREIQNRILTAYRMDISKHSSKTESIRIGMVLNSLPSQLARDNKKFIYGAIKKGGRASEFEMAIQWLVDAGVVYKVNRVSKIEIPLKAYEDFGAFKLFCMDVGLLCCMADIPAKILLLDREKLETYKGMVTEEFVAQQLVSNSNTIYYWSNDTTPSEIDFVMQYGTSVYPIEVKGGVNVKGKSIAQYIKKYPELKGLRFSLLPYREQDWITNYPLYSVPFVFG